MLKTVLFDVDGVLIDSLEANFTYFQRLFAHFGHAFVERTQYPHLFHLPMDKVIQTVLPHLTDAQQKEIWRFGVDQRIGLYPSELIKTPPKLSQVLHALSNDYVLGIVTSRIRHGVFSLPQLAPYESLFQVVVCFEDTSEHKPAPAPLLFACERLNINPQAVVYVGDAITDMQAASAAGTKRILYGGKQSALADAHCGDFEQLPTVIASLS